MNEIDLALEALASRSIELTPEAQAAITHLIVERERQKILILIHGNPLAELPRGLVHELGKRNRRPDGRQLTRFYGAPPIGSKPAAARNAVCPCGSGKKYKRCCARPAAGP